MINAKFLLIVAASATLLPACDKADRSAPTEAAQVNTAADEQAIRAVGRRWAELIRAKDANGIAQLYAADAMILPQGLQAFGGREAITRWWATDMATPGYDLRSQADQMIVSASGDLAVERGTYRYRATLAAGPVERRGKYVTVWRKADGDWKVAIDIYNLDHSAELRRP